VLNMPMWHRKHEPICAEAGPSDQLAAEVAAVDEEDQPD